MAARPAPTEHLPAVLRDIADELGLGAALALVRWRGGRHVYIPQTVPSDHPLALEVGAEAAAWLSERYGGDYLQVPRAGRYMQALRDAEIRRRRERDGMSAERLASEYRLHVRQIWRILSDRGDESGDDERQPPLI